jgi:hypothetical protein
MSKLDRKICRRIICLTANIDPDGTVWGLDTNCGQIEDIITQAEAIMQIERERNQKAKR